MTPLLDPRGRCYGSPNKEVLLTPISQVDAGRFKEIPITDDEFSEWCKPWRGSLMVTVLGRKVGLRQLETKLKRDWEKKGSIKIIDVPRDYYQDKACVKQASNEVIRWVLEDGGKKEEVVADERQLVLELNASAIKDHNDNNENKGTNEDVMDTINGNDSSIYGPWLLVKKPVRRYKGKGGTNASMHLREEKMATLMFSIM
ncbi:hypothetical protein JHK84_050775 [Glycine max]|nr:hypothetical protein JHK84_050775 [Glycine max]